MLAPLIMQAHITESSPQEQTFPRNIMNRPAPAKIPDPLHINYRESTIQLRFVPPAAAQLTTSSLPTKANHREHSKTHSATRSSNHSSLPLYVSIRDLIHAVTGFTPLMVCCSVHRPGVPLYFWGRGEFRVSLWYVNKYVYMYLPAYLDFYKSQNRKAQGPFSFTQPMMLIAGYGSIRCQVRSDTVIWNGAWSIIPFAYDFTALDFYAWKAVYLNSSFPLVVLHRHRYEWL